jgi:hypothetical protein
MMMITPFVPVNLSTRLRRADLLYEFIITPSWAGGVAGVCEAVLINRVSLHLAHVRP